MQDIVTKMVSCATSHSPASLGQTAQQMVPHVREQGVSQMSDTQLSHPRPLTLLRGALLDGAESEVVARGGEVAGTVLAAMMTVWNELAEMGDEWIEARVVLVVRSASLQSIQLVDDRLYLGPT